MQVCSYNFSRYSYSSFFVLSLFHPYPSSSILSSSSSRFSFDPRRRCSTSWSTAFLNWSRIFVRQTILMAAFVLFLKVRIFLMSFVRRGCMSSPFSVDHFRQFSKTCSTVMLSLLEQSQFALKMSGIFISYRKTLKSILLVRNCVNKTLSCFLSLMCVFIVRSIECDHKFLK